MATCNKPNCGCGGAPITFRTRPDGIVYPVHLKR